jgi:polar amino acid transport system substrate-binding protein
MAAGRRRHIAVTLKKGSGLEPVQTALNGVIKNGDYDKVLNRWGEGVNAFHIQSKPGRTG